MHDVQLSKAMSLWVIQIVWVFKLLQFSEENFTLRTVEDHVRKLTELEDDQDGSLSTEYGINMRSCLLDLQYFNLCSGAILPDVMHDVLEGALQYELKLLLQYCVRESQYFQVCTHHVSVACCNIYWYQY